MTFDQLFLETPGDVYHAESQLLNQRINKGTAQLAA